MKKIFLSALITAFAVTVVPAPGRAANTTNVGRVGIGVIAGEPTGLTVKFWLEDRQAVDVGLGWSFSGTDTLHVHADYLWHDFELLDTSGISGRIPVYYGIGARFKFRDSDGDPDHDDKFGVRIPIGVSWISESAPLDAFVELAPVLDLVPDTDLSLNGAIGLRYWFK